MTDTLVRVEPYWYYETSCIGEGSFGKVFKGYRDQDEQEPLAIKRIEKPKGRDIFLEREIQILQELSAPEVQHSNFVSLLDCIQTDRHVYLVMEYCNGGDLDHYLKEKGKMDEASVKIFLRQIAGALKTLLDHKVVHRDLKPANILLSYKGSRDISQITFKIADFGMGRFLEEGVAAQTFCGTPVFMAPEIFVPNAKYNYKADLWSIGAIVYNCFTGNLYSAFQNEPISFPAKMNPSLKDLLIKLLIREPAKRISFTEFSCHPFIGIDEVEAREKVAKSRDSGPRISRTEGLVWLRRVEETRRKSGFEPEKEYKPHSHMTYMGTVKRNPPESFNPVSMKQFSSDSPKLISQATPSRPFKDTNVFQNVDKHALEVTKEEHKSFRDLVWHLIFARSINNELEIARAIFIWLCCKDLSKLNFENVEKGSAEEILMKLQSRHTSYAAVYESLCSFSGLYCEIIRGYAKAGNYKPGMKIAGEQNQHSWNAVCVDGIWRLVDCSWARSKTADKKLSLDDIHHQLDEFYFMPNPQQFILTHFPDDVSSQLLSKPITLAEFENLVSVTSTFFKHGLEIISHREAVIRTKQEVVIRIGWPLVKGHSSPLTFELKYDDGRKSFQGIELDRFGMQEVKDDESFLTIRPPEKGSYHLTIYSKDLKQQTEKHTYVNACEYELVCEVNPVHPLPFPPCKRTVWGPGDSAARYSLVPLQNGSVLSTVNGMAEVRFQVAKDMQFSARLKSNEMDERALAGYIMQRKVGDNVVFTINAPSKGEFGLELYTNDPEVDGDTLYHAYQYLIICKETPKATEELPEMPSGFLGPQSTYKNLGLSTVTHHDPFIQTEVNVIKVSFKTTEPLQMSSKLLYASRNSYDERSQYVLQQSEADNIVFLVKLSKSGLYKFQVFANPRSDASNKLSNVYNYLISCTTKQEVSMIPYPEQYSQWKDGCYLHEPLEGQLQRNRIMKGSASTMQHFYFKMDVPKAKKVALVVDKDWTQLELKASGSWEGEINMEKYWGHETKLTVCANYGVTKDSYSNLLVYSI